MLIAQIVCSFPPYRGGIGNVAHQYATELSKLGHEVTIFTTGHGKDNKNREAQFLPFRVERLSKFFCQGNAGFWLPLLWKLKKFDIVHLHYPFFGTAEIVLLAKKMGLCKKLVLTYHMDVFGKGFYKKMIFQLHTKFILPKIIKLSDYVIVTSLDYANQSAISKLTTYNQQKIIEMPLGIDIDHFKPANKDLHFVKTHHLDINKASVILFVGNLDQAHYFKGVDILLKAVAGLDGYDYKLLIIGDGDMKLKYQQIAYELSILGTKVTFVGAISNEELVKYYNLCDFLVLPSIDSSEAFGLVLVEAMACGKTVIASNIRGVRSVIDNNINGLLAEANNVKDLTTKIKIFLEHKDMVAEFGQNAYKKAAEKYDSKKIGASLDKLYKTLSA